MFCKKCGQEISDQTKYCPVCGEPTENQENNFDQPYQPQPRVRADDQSVAGYNVLSFFFPLVGLILYLVWKQEYPIRAKNCGKWALISFIINIVLSICYVIVFVLIASSGNQSF